MADDEESSTLRENAEAILAHGHKRSEHAGDISTDDYRRQIHELDVHRVELQLQNDELRRTQHDLEQARDRYASLYDFAPVGYFTLSGNGRIVEANLTGARLFGFDRQTLKNSPFAAFVQRKLLPTFHDHIAEVLATGGRLSCELGLMRADGSTFSARLESMADRDDDGGGRQVRIAIIDITEHIIVKEALAAAKMEAERANAEKTRFLGAASHDLRQPLQALIWYIGILPGKINDDQTLELIARCEESASMMSETIDTLLDINQLDSGHLQPDLKRFPISIIFGSLAKVVASDARMQDINLRVLQSRDEVSSDPRLLVHVLRNLVSNAVKYTASKVLLGCRRHGDTLRIEVLDNGIGIPEKQLRTIFEEFHQIDNPTRERGKGLGLGLSIVLRLANILGHNITVRSQLGRGSVFTISVPLCPRRAKPRPPAPSLYPFEPSGAPRPDSPILIVEDDPAVRDALRLMLEKAGYRTIPAVDGDSAQAAIKNADVPPGMVISDYNLPGSMDGLQAVMCLRALLPSHRLPAIILTADISEVTRQEVARHGCEYLRKPVPETELIMCIRRVGVVADVV